jgi:transposase
MTASSEARCCCPGSLAVPQETSPVYPSKTGTPAGQRRRTAARRPDAHLEAWLGRASRSRIPAVIDLFRTIRKDREQILAAVDVGLSNSKVEG